METAVRFLLTRKGCPHCRDFIKAVQPINQKLPVHKRIEIIDGWDWEEHGVMMEPILEKFNKEGLSEEGYPLCYLDGLILDNNFSTPDVLNAFLNKFLEEDIIE